MDNIYSPQEILRIAVAVETNGRDLYSELKKKTNNDSLRRICDYLSAQEDAHRKIFQEMLDSADSSVVPEFSPGEYSSYIKAIASSYVFTQELIARKTKELFGSDLEAVEFGIYIEKESILTYISLKEYVSYDKQSVIDKIIEEEKKHLADLTSLKNSLKK